MFDRILQELPERFLCHLDDLLVVDDVRTSRLEWLKSVPNTPSASAILRLTEKLKAIAETGVLALDLSCLNNNYQRSLARCVKTSSVHRLRRIEPAHRYTLLVCFLKQAHQDTIDFLIDMLDKLLCRITGQAEREMDGAMKQRRDSIQRSSSLFQTVAGVLLDEDIPDDAVRSHIFNHVSRESLQTQTASLREWTDGKYSHVFYGISRWFPYLRRFSPSLFETLTFEGQGHTTPAVLPAIETLRIVNGQKKRNLPEDVPIDFIPKRFHPFVSENGTVNRQAWECALLLSIRDELKSGNLAVAASKRFGQFDQFSFLMESGPIGVKVSSTYAVPEWLRY